MSKTSYFLLPSPLIYSSLKTSRGLEDAVSRHVDFLQSHFFSTCQYQECLFWPVCCHLSYMLSWSHNSTSVCYSTTILLESSDVNLGVHWFTVLCVQKHNKKAAHAPEHWSDLVCCMHQSVCSQHIHLNTEQKSRKSLPTGRKKYNTRTMLYIDIFVFCFSDMEFSYPVFSDLVVEDEG